MQNNTILVSEKNDLGKKGEQLAMTFLQEKDYVILHTNWRFQKAELDIIAQQDKITVFVEVKTRKDNYFGYPERAVHPAKEHHLHRAAQAFIEQYKIENEIRFDIISITFKNNQPIIDHIEDAFFPK